MDERIKYWFNNFVKTIEEMSADERTSFFRSCGRNCVEQGILPIYKKIFKDSGEDINVFFKRLNDFDGVHTETVVPQKEYVLCFERCVCPLHAGGYVSTPKLCECSCHSIVHVMNTLLPDRKVGVKPLSTIIGGAEECRMNIVMQ